MHSIIAQALWTRLDTPGHDAAFLIATGNSFELRGGAVFRSAGAPARIAYRVELGSDWTARAGHIRGEIGMREIAHEIVRTEAGWMLDGTPVDGLSHVRDLDFGFTPATNMTALRRAGLKIGEAADLPAAWFDVESEARLTFLPQRYERRGETSYFYRSPTAGYEAVLDMAPNGFTRVYPGLWEMID